MKPRDSDSHLISISRIHKHAGEEFSVLRLRGVVRGSTSEDFRSRLQDAGMRSPYVVVDLSELDYLNATGLGMLLEQGRTQEKKHGWLRIVAPSPAVSMIFRLSGAAKTLALYPDEALALADGFPEAA